MVKSKYECAIRIMRRLSAVPAELLRGRFCERINLEGNGESF